MSNSYPSRRELRQQREREARAKLRDQEAQRWAEENEERQQRGADATPVPASDITDGTDEPPATPDEPEESTAHGRRAAASPVDAPADVEEPMAEPPPETLPRRRRRADSHVTSTGMLPLITKRGEHQASKPRSRREARKIAADQSAERRAEIAALQQQQAEAEQQEPRIARRADAPQAPPPPVPVVADVPIDPHTSDDSVEISTSDQHAETAAEITDMSGLDTLEIRRAELRAETEKLTQEIIQLGESNPNVIDPLLLRRQKELAEKSQELQELETTAISIFEDTDDEDSDAEAAESDVVDEPAGDEIVADDDGSDDAAESSEPDAATGFLETEQQDTDTALKLPQPPRDDDEGPSEDLTQPLTRARRATTGPPISGPFEVSEDQDLTDQSLVGESKPDFSTHLQVDDTPETGPDQPLEASSAHGLDTLDPKETEAPERRIFLLSAAVFAIGIIALIIAIILLTS